MLGCYKHFTYFIVVLGFLSYSHFGYTNVTVEKVDDTAKTAAPSSSDAANTAKTAAPSSPDTANTAKTTVPSPSDTVDIAEAAEGKKTQVPEEVKTTNIEVDDTFKMPDHRFEFTGLFGFTGINNTRTPLKWNFSGDILYRIMKHDRWMSSIGLRYRTFFSHPGSGDDSSNSIYAGEFVVHQLTWISQTLIFFEDKLKLKGFFGPVFGINIWRYLRIDYEDDTYITSSEFLLSWLSVQFGIKTGIMLSSHFAFTTEIGLDVLGFRKYKEEVDDELKEKRIYLPLNNMYITLGLSYFL